jgi:hypothetical protein
MGGENSTTTTGDYWKTTDTHAAMAVMWLVPDRRMEQAVHVRRFGRSHGGA